MSAERVDVAILGGGCAGLSLASRLAGSSLRVCVIEPRTEYAEDRTWSFWSDAASDPELERRCWTRWRVSDAFGRMIERRSGRFTYRTLSSLAFYRRAIERCRDDRNVAIELGARCDQASSSADDGLVETSLGAIRARHVIDTRPTPQTARYAQFFVGLEIETDGPVFDAAAVDLMAFHPPKDDAVAFDYVLPFARDRALVEATIFSETPPPPGVLDAMAATAVEQRAGGRAARVMRREVGVLAMDVARAAQSPEPIGWRAFGLRGDAGRPSTGYAFKRIQRAADRLAKKLIAEEPLGAPECDPPVTRWMDGLFLRVLRNHPEAAPTLFLDLFANARPDRLEAFLEGSTAMRDRLAVVSAMPPLRFLSMAAA